jgi:hypothetical protein
MQIVSYLNHIVVSSVASLVLPYFSTLFHTRNMGFRIAFPVGPNRIDVSFTLLLKDGDQSFRNKFVF